MGTPVARTMPNERVTEAAKEDVMRIILAVDDSRWSNAAVDLVRRTHWQKDTRVIVVTAIATPLPAFSLVDAGGHLLDAEILEANRRAGRDVVTRVERDLRETGLPIQTEVALGDPREVILRIAQEHGADLIVVGSHGRSGLPKLLMGSVATHVVTHAPCNVLVVKGEPQGMPGHRR
jgi:nucleotide-binding universal stress UspA family protein